MSTGSLVAVFGASLVGSLHCAGMCGGLAAFATGRDPRARGGCDTNSCQGSSSDVLNSGVQMGYNGGRMLAYLSLGALAGSFGAGIDGAGQVAGIGHAATFVSALAMITWGIWSLTPGKRPANIAGFLSRRFSATLGLARRCPGLLRASLVGAGTGLLPCGWLYAFVVAAAGTGSVAGGTGLMLAFWAGTLPVLLGLGSVTRYFTDKLRGRLPTLSAAVILLIGLGNLYQHFRVPAEVLSQLTQNHSDSAARQGPAPKCH